MTRASIEKELLQWMKCGDWSPDPKRFERIALSLFEFQSAHCNPYSRLGSAIGRTPEMVREAKDIPAVPTGAFKEFALRCFDADRTIRTFHTSGTSTDRRGALHLDRLDLYDASLLASLRYALLVQSDGDPAIDRMRFLVASPDEAPDSSLSYMFGELSRVEGGHGCGFDLHDGELDRTSLQAAVQQARVDNSPMLLAGTAFAFVHFLDRPDSEDWTLPEGSRVMETGGFKGSIREVTRSELHAQLAARFSIPDRSIINQYGMTELGSQFYDSTLVDPDGPRRKLIPPWTRVRFVDPATAEDVQAGEIGMILIQDLANTGSIAAIQTADLGREILDDEARSIGFEVIGRAEGAEARGCSIATDIMLEASRGDGR